MANNGFRLGIEVETLLAPKDIKTLPMETDLDVFANTLAKYYNNARDPARNFLMRADIGRKYTGTEYQDWVLTDDITLKGNVDNEYLVEFVSPILKASPSQNTWRHEIADLFRHIQSSYVFRTNKSCGFHVHLSPIGSGWSLGELQTISVAIIHFECAFEALLPETRRGNQWIKSNRFVSNPTLQGKTHSKVVEEIFKQKTVKELVALMSPDRYRTWNFYNLRDGNPKGTVEFRQPPGQTHATGCLAWTELAINFIQSARRPNWHLRFAEYPQNVSGLRKFISEGFIQGISQEKYLAPIFDSKPGGLAKVPKSIEHPDLELWKQKEKEDKKKNILMAKLKAQLKKESQKHGK